VNYQRPCFITATLPAALQPPPPYPGGAGPSQLLRASATQEMAAQDLTWLPDRLSSRAQIEVSQCLLLT